MLTLKQTLDGLVASREFDAGSLTRFAYWAEILGSMPLDEITDDDVDRALVRLAQRGPVRNVNGRQMPTGKPLTSATINRYISSLMAPFRYARKHRLLPRGHVPPTRGIDKEPERPDPDRYLRVEEVQRLVRVARVIDRHWRRLPALISLAFTTGLRKGNLMALTWGDVDLEAGTATVLVTKNGEPQIAALTPAVIKELKRLPGDRQPTTLLFGSEKRPTRPYTFRKLWSKACEEARLLDRNFHQLRHGCGTHLALAGENQASIMAIMGHKTLTASRRYLHHNTQDKRRTIERAFAGVEL